MVLGIGRFGDSPETEDNVEHLAEALMPIDEHVSILDNLGAGKHPQGVKASEADCWVLNQSLGRSVEGPETEDEVEHLIGALMPI